jgi:aminodeoxyfutalosine deaminase
VFPSLADHSLPVLLEAGAFVTINTDDPPMFSTTLNDEYLRIAAAFNLNVDDIARLVINAVEASFMAGSAKSALLHTIDTVLEAHRA